MQAGGPLLDDHRLIYEVISALSALGYAEKDISWSESCSPPTSDEQFALETIFVICNSGMQNKVAARIFAKCRDAILDGGSATDVFGHEGKAKAMDDIWARRTELHAGFLAAEDKIAFCRSIPWIGGITCYHLAKNFGCDVAKPDTHLQKLAARHSTTAQDLCEVLAQRTGFRISTIDLILWRACAEHILDPRSGEIKKAVPETPITKPIQHELFQPVQQELFA